MKRTLLNKVFHKFPTIGNIDKLFDLSCEELNEIILCDEIESAKEVFSNIIISKEENKDEVKVIPSKLILKPTKATYYVDL